MRSWILKKQSLLFEKKGNRLNAVSKNACTINSDFEINFKESNTAKVKIWNIVDECVENDKNIRINEKNGIFLK